MAKVYVGWDERDELAYRATVTSMLDHSSIPLEIIPIKDHEMRRAGVYWRDYVVEHNGQKVDGRDGKPFSTGFSFTRFCIPFIDKADDWVLFIDGDVLFFDDVAKLFAQSDDRYAIQCVQHDFQPEELTKFDGFKQERYFRKNWSSVMLMRPAKLSLTPYQLNMMTGSFLHGLLWQKDEEIGALSPEWNVLDGYQDIKPALYHYTRGTPDMIGNDLAYSDIWWDAVKRWKP